MPIYEYRCRKCDHQFEKFRPMDDDGSELACPECGRRSPDRVLSVFAASAKTAESGGAGGCGPSGFS